MTKAKHFIIRKLKDIDFLGNKFIFTFDGKDRYSTAFGAFLTILSLIAVAYSLYYFGLQFFDTSSPIIYKEEALDFASTQLDFHLLDYYFSLCLSVDEMLPRSDIERLSTTVLTITDVKNENPSMSNSSHYFMEDCIKAGLQHYKTIHQFSESYANIIEEFSLCLPEIKDEYWVKGSYFDTNHRRMSLSIYPCILDDPINACQTPNEFPYLIAYFGVTRSSVNIASKNSAVSKSLDYDSFSSLSPASTTIHHYTYKRTTIYDSDLDYTPMKMRDTFLELDEKSVFSKLRDSEQLYCTKEMIIDGSCQPYFTIHIKPSSKHSKIVRQYPRLMELISNAGGLIDVILWVAILINRLYQKFQYKQFLKKKMLKMNAQEFLKYFPDKTQKEIDQLLVDIVQKKKDGVELLDNLYEVDLLSKLYLKNEHRMLVPLLLIKIKENEKKKNESSKTDKIKPSAERYNKPVDSLTTYSSLLSMIQELEENNTLGIESRSELSTTLTEYYIAQTAHLLKHIRPDKQLLQANSQVVSNNNEEETNKHSASNSLFSKDYFKQFSQVSESGFMARSRTLKKKAIVVKRTVKR